MMLFQEELVNLKQIPNSLAVFCLATYGEGDPTDNAMEFYEWLHNGDADLAGLNYAVSRSFELCISAVVTTPVYLAISEARENDR